MTREQIDRFLRDYFQVCRKHGLLIDGFDDGPFVSDRKLNRAYVAKLKDCYSYRYNQAHEQKTSRGKSG